MRYRVLLVVSASFAVACSTTNHAECVVGASVACVCANGQAGAQVCQSDRTFGMCSCEATTADGGLPDAGIPGTIPDAAIADGAGAGADAIAPAIDGGPPDAGEVNSGTYYHYVTDSLKVGASATEADSYAFNLDGSGAKNALGHVLAGLHSQLDFDSAIAASIMAGQTVLLHSIRADSLSTDSTASWQVYLGDPKANPVLTGGGSFTIASISPTNGKLIGAITGGQFAGGPGTVELQIGLVQGAPPIDITLIGAQIQATCDARGCTNAKIGGGITASDMMTKVIPAMAAGLQAQIDADTGCASTCPASASGCSSQTQQFLSLFDTQNAAGTAGHDCKITADELSKNALIKAVLMPDVDVFKADGTPGQDGTLDSVSVGFGFTTKSAVFSAPGE